MEPSSGNTENSYREVLTLGKSDSGSLAAENSTVTMEFVRENSGRTVPLPVVSDSKRRANNGHEQPHTMIGRRVSRYRILSQLGKGGMGVIYRAQDLRLGRHVAIKFAAREFQTNPAICECIRREAYLGSTLNHSQVCTVYDIGDFEGRPYFVMELLEGRSLRHFINGSMPVEKFLHLAIQMASGLEAVHGYGIVHRDIKPSNVLVSSSGHAKIADFGLAILATEPSHTAVSEYLRTFRGTPAYMSPEQVVGERLDWRTDLFSLGTVYYEMLTGMRPFQGVTISGILAAVLHGSCVPIRELRPELPVKIEELIGNLLEKDREHRCQSAAELRWNLEQLRQ